ncbi:MAG: flippase-like domain-containing protein [Nitrospirae bacterium]|nr:flippase-like domain-containing protein [Nitrospirota bacterium]
MKKALSIIVKILISGALLYIFFKQVDIKSVGNILKHTDLRFFILSFLVYASLLLVSTKRWALFLPGGLKYSKLVSLYFIGSFFNTLLPGIVSGDALKAFYLYKHTGKGTGGTSLASVFMDRYMGLTAMICIGFFAYILGYSYMKAAGMVWWAIPSFAAAFLLGSIALWTINWGKIKALNTFYTPLMEYKKEKKIIYMGLLYGFIIQIIGITSVYILSFSINLNLPIIYFFIFVPIINVAAAIPISVFGGSGVREAGFIILFGSIGVAKEDALSLSLLLFAIMCLISLIGGIEYLRVGKPKEVKS